MKIDVVSLFPRMFESVFGESIIGRAIKNKILELDVHNLRDWAIGDYGTVDDKPFGGGAGMLIRADVIFNAINGVKAQNLKSEFSNKNKKEDTKLQQDCHVVSLRTAPRNDKSGTKVVVLSAKGKRYNQKKAEELSKLDNLILLCGHYEGFDQRVMDYMADEVISIGDYVLTGGETPAMILIDSVVRLLPGVLGKEESKEVDSFSEVEIKGKKVRKVEYPQYTRPREFMGHKVPKILLSGDHERIKKWKKDKILNPNTQTCRPTDKF